MKLNWITKSFIYFAVATIAGPYFDNWTSTEKFLFLSDSYISECDKSEIIGPPTDTFKCEKQQIAVSKLLTYARMPEFLSAVTLGIFVDRFGPKIVSIIGVLFCILSFLFLSQFSKYGFMLKLSMIFIGLTTNATLFPALTIERYTKKYKSQVMIFICSCSSFSCFVIKILEVLARKTSLTPKMISLYFTLFFLVPCLVISLFVFPNDLKEDVKKIGEYDEDFNKSPINYNQMSKQLSMAQIRLSSESKRSNLSQLASKNSLNSSENNTNSLTERNVETYPIGNQIKKTTLEHDMSDFDSSRDLEDGMTHKKWNFRGYLHTLNSFEVVLCTLYLCLNVVATTYSQQSFTLTYSSDKKLLEFFEYILPFSFVPCVIFILFAKCINSYFLLLIIGILWIMLNITSMFFNYISGLLTAILITISYSMYSCHVYIYVESVVPKDYYSSVLGLLNTAGGLSMLLNIFVISPITDKKVIFNINLALLAVRGFFLVVFTFIYFKNHFLKSKENSPMIVKE